MAKIVIIMTLREIIRFLLHIQILTNLFTSVSIVTRLRAGRPGFNSRQWQEWVFFSLRYLIQTGCGIHSASNQMSTGDLRQG
jgi:ABC-type antimicrobial peptide transport system permease subunit